MGSWLLGVRDPFLALQARLCGLGLRQPTRATTTTTRRRVVAIVSGARNGRSNRNETDRNMRSFSRDLSSSNHFSKLRVASTSISRFSRRATCPTPPALYRCRARCPTHQWRAGCATGPSTLPACDTMLTRAPSSRSCLMGFRRSSFGDRSRGYLPLCKVPCASTRAPGRCQLPPSPCGR